MLIKSLEDGRDMPKDILYALALLHDIGRACQYEGGQEHTRAGAALAREILPQCGYGEEEVKAIATAIAAHHDEAGCDDLSFLLQSADRESRNCFLCPASEDCYWPESKKNKGVVL
jgi:HD superfamily phosphodiesterase